MIPFLLVFLTTWIAVPGSTPSSITKHISRDSVVVRDPLLQVGEELEYNVSYSIFNVGTIRILIVGKEQRNGREVFKTRAIIDSNPSLSWLVDLHIRFTSEMDGDLYSYSWIGDDSTAKETKFRRITFQYDSSRMVFDKGKKLPNNDLQVESVDTIAVGEKCQDGFTVFFYARKHVHQKKQVNVPTFIENKKVNTFINFMNSVTDVNIDAVDYPVEVVEFDGKADYVGVFGLTGGFSGQFSNDDARIPIVARMNVILGSIKVELKSWKREGWRPPKFVERD
ncbi:MAG: DUF3108 domain-containing protein [Bacteroidota bacterium]